MTEYVCRFLCNYSHVHVAKNHRLAEKSGMPKHSSNALVVITENQFCQTLLHDFLLFLSKSTHKSCLFLEKKTSCTLAPLRHSKSTRCEQMLKRKEKGMRRACHSKQRCNRKRHQRRATIQILGQNKRQPHPLKCEIKRNKTRTEPAQTPRPPQNKKDRRNF